MSAADEEFNALADELARRAKLDSWSAFVEELQVPSDLAPAFMTGRPELVRLAPPRDLSAAEAETLYRLIAGLLETNAALREHAQAVAKLTQNLHSQFVGVHKMARRLGSFANFRHSETEEEA